MGSCSSSGTIVSRVMNLRQIPWTASVSKLVKRAVNAMLTLSAIRAKLFKMKETPSLARMAKLADAADLKSADPNRSWGFDSPSGHQSFLVKLWVRTVFKLNFALVGR